MMSRLHGKLTALAVKHALKRGIHRDGGGLYLQVARGGSRSWILRYRLGGRRRHLGLGGYPTVSLAEARERAGAARLMLQKGDDPVEKRRGQRVSALLAGAKAMTFAQCATAYMAAQGAGWSAESTQQWSGTLSTYAFPILGRLPVQAIDTTSVLQVIEPLWTTKTEIAARLRGRIEKILDWAKVRGYRQGENPARWHGHLENLLPAKSKITKTKHHAAIHYIELPAFMASLRQREGLAARALEFAILTAARSGEVLYATWDEIDLQVRTWTVPATRMKAGREHRVPLSSSAIAILQALPGTRTGLVFPGIKPGRPLSDRSFIDILARMGCSFTTHGFRSCFRDWVGDRTGFERDVVEAALAHAVGNKTEAAYRRSDALEKRRKLMQTWADYCAGIAIPAGEIIELRRA
jgi:integrase